MKPIMTCGHAANAIDAETKIPVCVICNCETMSDLQVPMNRVAKCVMCETKVSSNSSLAFFEYKPNFNQDGFYCGCRGWD